MIPEQAFINMGKTDAIGYALRAQTPEDEEHPDAFRRGVEAAAAEIRGEVERANPKKREPVYAERANPNGD